MDPPGWVTVIRSIDLPGRPENMQPEECSFMLPPGCDTVRISPFDVTGEDELRGIYLDRIRIE